MKTTKFLTFSLLIALISCNSGENTTAQKANFGIYETVNVNEIPACIIDSLKTKNLQFEGDTSLPTIGYILSADSMVFEANYSKEGIRLIKSKYTVDKEGKYNAVVAVRQSPVLTNTDIQKAIAKGNNVELHFNMEGSKKWAETTRKNLEKQVAFVINDEVYSLPLIKGEIKNGIALIVGLNDETIAKKVASSL
jgi:preprotein translocase subunit SecD